MRFIPSDRRWWVLAMGVLIGVDAADLIAQEKPAIVRIESDKDEKDIDDAVVSLGSAEFKTRDAATEKLIAAGERARAALEKAAKSDDAETANRAKTILARINISLRLTLTLSANTIKAGEAFPTFRVDLANSGKEPLTVMLPIDGCDVGWRAVQYTWHVTDEKGKAVSLRKILRCGNTNPVRKEDFATLEPSKSTLIVQGAVFLESVHSLYAIDKPGKYRIQLHYSYDPKRPNKGLPLGKDEDISELAEKAAVISVESNAVEIELTK